MRFAPIFMFVLAAGCASTREGPGTTRSAERAPPEAGMSREVERACRRALAEASQWNASGTAYRAGGQAVATETLDRVVARLTGCGRAASPVLAGVTAGLRTSEDSARTVALVMALRTFRDSAVFAGTLRLADDPGAPVHARVGALYMLYVVRTGEHWHSIASLAPSGPAILGAPVADCGRNREAPGARPFFTVGHPLPSSYPEQIQALAEWLFRDPAQPARVRAAASCAIMSGDEADSTTASQSQRERRECHQAARIVERGRPEPRARWARTALHQCPGSLQASAWAAAMRAGRQQTDDAVLRELFGNASLWRDTAVFASAIAIAGDQAASPRARVYALIVLNRMLFPAEWAEYSMFAEDRIGSRGDVIRCLASRSVHHGVKTTSELPADHAAIIERTARALVDDPDTPPDVRKAASCLT